MNERIKELLDQSGIKVKSDLSGFNLPEDINLYHAQGFDLEKFAELIVEECRYVMDCNKGSDQHTEWNRALSETSEKIKQHFGVE